MKRKYKDEDDDSGDDTEDYEIDKKIKLSIEIKCKNPLCDHKDYIKNDPELWYKSNPIDFKQINKLEDLISLSNQYHCIMRPIYNGINLKALYDIRSDIQDLLNMIGLQKIKETILDILLYFLISDNVIKFKLNPTMLHSVVTGPPGCGKTTFIGILASIYTKLGILSKGHIVKVKREDLIAKYLGQTTAKTMAKIYDAQNGIFLLDEAYALGNNDQSDSYSKECIDCINQALSENKGSFICIIAGYKDALEESFFKYNDGLNRRFTYKFDIEKYSSDDLSTILINKIKTEYKMKVTENEIKEMIKKEYGKFKNQGGDMESLKHYINVCHNRRVFMIKERNVLEKIDILEAITKFIDKKEEKEIPLSLYM